MRFVVVLLLAMVFGQASVAQEQDIRSTISAQIEAFQADDFVGAFDYASPNIQNIFRTPDNFGAMVRRGYPMVWRPAEVRYLELREIAGQLWQKVLITDAQGAVHVLDYQMVQQENGWKINGVQLVPQPGASA
ncbi:MAG: DUF4864 domain-containing protein [Rhodobacteraceae bacterium]|nr:DUF4864 domain-containing protein [Paracoccaceae bacterium]